MTVRTRFAPSPTGYLHLGGLRTALYTYLYARRTGGRFILRIEDTDQEREIPGAVQKIYDSMRQAGLTYDEGPDVGGEYGPYIQSERKAMYLPYAKQLVESGHAYYCFCTKEKLEADRERAEKEGRPYKYEKDCLKLSKEEVERRLAAGESYVIRQNVPTEGKAGFDDVLYGHVEVDCSTLDDNVLIKADGLPTYNFANVIDDHTMGITHVMRGTEYLSSAPKYNLLYEAFGWDIPTYVHCASVMITDPETKTVRKMSKRHGDPSYEDLLKMGYLSDAILNYVTLLGWSPKGDIAEQEFFTMEELIQVFDIDGISKSPSAFDMEKLKYFNSHYIRSMTPEAFAKAAEPYIRQTVQNPNVDVAEIADLLHQRTETMNEIPEKVDFFDKLPDYDIALYTHKKSKTNAEISLEMLQTILPRFEALEPWEPEGIKAVMTDLAAELEVKNAKIMWPVRIAIAGKAVTPGGAVEIAHILGKEESIARMKQGIEKLSV